MTFSFHFLEIRNNLVFLDLQEIKKKLSKRGNKIVETILFPEKFHYIILKMANLIVGSNKFSHV